VPIDSRFRDEAPGPDRPVVSVVIPCLNEVRAIATCVEKARRALAEQAVNGEVVVVDNGSSDGSAEAALRAGAEVVYEPRRGYGSAYLAGFAAARGQYFVMGDGDDTYDFQDIPRFTTPLIEGRADLVIGDRLGGDIRRGAMSWSHRWIGNPLLSGMLRLLFRTRISDAHCGMRAFTRDAWERMRLGAIGMEFASEMIVSALRERLRIAEIPITYHPRLGESKLQGFRDAWRHVRFMLLFSPSYLFLMPGLLLMISGGVIAGALLPGPRTFLGRTWDYHPLLFGASMLILGYNLVLFDVLAKAYSMAAGFAQPGRWLKGLRRSFSLERGVMAGLLLFAAGVAAELAVVAAWVRSGYGELMAVRQIVVGMALMVVGVQTLFASFLVSLMDIERQPSTEQDVGSPQVLRRTGTP
jgi:glycosyltransferase involved in cell wall biosynthesis